MDGDEEEETSDEDENEDDKLNLTGQDDTSQIETFKKMVLYMKPGESVLKAIKRLGNSSKGSQSVGTMSASQRWLKKKNQTILLDMELHHIFQTLFEHFLWLSWCWLVRRGLDRTRSWMSSDVASAELWP